MDEYTYFADFYDELTYNVDYKKRAEYILNILKHEEHKSGLVLDLACGTGSLTLELKKIPGLYLTGEIIDVTGDCGGYNLQWAWSTAGCVADAVTDKLK